MRESAGDREHRVEVRRRRVLTHKIERIERSAEAGRTVLVCS